MIISRGDDEESYDGSMRSYLASDPFFFTGLVRWDAL